MDSDVFILHIIYLWIDFFPRIKHTYTSAIFTVLSDHLVVN